jgi:hypothetical protein
MSARTAQVGLAPLLRSEALWLLGGVRMGLIVSTQDAMTLHRPGFHTLVGGDVVIRTPMGTELDALLGQGLPLTYRAESMDDRTLAGWYATVTGRATAIEDPYEHDHYQRVLPAFTGGNRIIRLRPQLICGDRFQRLSAGPNPN